MEIPRKSHVCFPVALSPSQLIVQSKNLFNRHCASKILENRMEEIWNRRISDNPHLFNGTKFRYAGLFIKRGRVVTENDGLQIVLPPADGSLCVEMHTGFGSYKEYASTNLESDFAEELLMYGEKMYDDVHACMGDIIGHSAFLVTADGHVVIQLRSKIVGEAPGMWHFPGGHPEPEEIGIRSTKDFEKADPVKIVEEIYSSLLREMKEELNLSEDLLKNLRLFSIGKNKGTFYKPELNFILFTPLLAHEVAACYHAEGFHDDESDDIAFWAIDDLKLNDDQEDIRLYKFKSGLDSEVLSVNKEFLADSSVQLLRCLPSILKYNPLLFEF